MSKKTASVIGIVLGVVIIIIGFCVMNPDTYSLGKRDSLGSLIEFGGDFYTEIYHMTYQTAHQVQKAYVNICNAIGWLIVAIGLLDVAYFVYKMAPREADGAGNTCDVKPTTATSTYMVPRHQVSTSAPAPIVTHSWRCDNCGKMITQFPCEHCGYAIEKEHIPYWCGNCGHAGPYDDRCPKCGSSLKRFNVSQN